MRLVPRGWTKQDQDRAWTTHSDPELQKAQLLVPTDPANGRLLRKHWASGDHQPKKCRDKPFCFYYRLTVKRIDLRRTFSYMEGNGFTAHSLLQLPTWICWLKVYFDVYLKHRMGPECRQFDLRGLLKEINLINHIPALNTRGNGRIFTAAARLCDTLW